MARIELLIIDPQRSFTEPATGNSDDVGVGSLFVPGAPDDMERLADFIIRNKSKIDDVHVTLDSHHRVHIASPLWWKNSKGDHPNPFTLITHKEVLEGKWMATLPSLQRWSLEYTQKLEQAGKYQLMVWPEHCIIQTPGSCIDFKLAKALHAWQEEFCVIDYVTKGSNIYVESYSALKAEVVRNDDPTTQLNTRLINALLKADLIAISGEALSHCVRSTVLDIATAFGTDEYIKKLVLLEDCCSSIQGFEKETEDFIKEMTARGMQLSTTDKFLK